MLVILLIHFKHFSPHTAETIIHDHFESGSELDERGIQRHSAPKSTRESYCTDMKQLHNNFLTFPHRVIYSKTLYLIEFREPNAVKKRAASWL
jgi:hypothetical protein